MAARANVVSVLREGGRGNTSRAINLVTRGLVEGRRPAGVIVPGAAIFVTVLGLNFLGDGGNSKFTLLDSRSQVDVRQDSVVQTNRGGGGFAEMSNAQTNGLHELSALFDQGRRRVQ